MSLTFLRTRDASGACFVSCLPQSVFTVVLPMLMQPRPFSSFVAPFFSVLPGP